MGQVQLNIEGGIQLRVTKQKKLKLNYIKKSFIFYSIYKCKKYEKFQHLIQTIFLFREWKKSKLVGTVDWYMCQARSPDITFVKISNFC